jgi:hypothetical protein
VGIKVRYSSSSSLSFPSPFALFLPSRRNNTTSKLTFLPLPLAFPFVLFLLFRPHSYLQENHPSRLHNPTSRLPRSGRPDPWCTSPFPLFLPLPLPPSSSPAHETPSTAPPPQTGRSTAPQGLRGTPVDQEVREEVVVGRLNRPLVLLPSFLLHFLFNRRFVRSFRRAPSVPLSRLRTSRPAGHGRGGLLFLFSPNFFLPSASLSNFLPCAMRAYPSCAPSLFCSVSIDESMGRSSQSAKERMERHGDFDFVAYCTLQAEQRERQ